MQRTASPDAEVDGGGGAAAHFFSKKDVQVDWDKVSRVAPLVDQALGDMSKEPTVVANARKLEKFYPHLVRWDVTRSNMVYSYSGMPLFVFVHTHSHKRSWQTD